MCTRKGEVGQDSVCVCIPVLGQILQMASCRRVAPAAGMEKRTGKTHPPPHLLHPTQSILVGANLLENTNHLDSTRFHGSYSFV